MSTAQIKKAFAVWPQIEPTLRVPHNDREYRQLVKLLDRLIDEVGDYVYLNPVRAKLLKPQERLRAYPWSRLGLYLAAPPHRRGWLRVDRLLGEHGIQRDDQAGRGQFERQMEARRAEESDLEEWKLIRRGWCLGSAEFKENLHRWRQTRELSNNVQSC